jgi:hypothetical protein
MGCCLCNSCGATPPPRYLRITVRQYCPSNIALYWRSPLLTSRRQILAGFAGLSVAVSGHPSWAGNGGATFQTLLASKLSKVIAFCAGLVGEQATRLLKQAGNAPFGNIERSIEARPVRSPPLLDWAQVPLPPMAIYSATGEHGASPRHPNSDSNLTSGQVAARAWLPASFIWAAIQQGSP